MNLTIKKVSIPVLMFMIAQSGFCGTDDWFGWSSAAMLQKDKAEIVHRMVFGASDIKGSKNNKVEDYKTAAKSFETAIDAGTPDRWKGDAEFKNEMIDKLTTLTSAGDADADGVKEEIINVIANNFLEHAPFWKRHVQITKAMQNSLTYVMLVKDTATEEEWKKVLRGEGGTEIINFVLADMCEELKRAINEDVFANTMTENASESVIDIDGDGTKDKKEQFIYAIVDQLVGLIKTPKDAEGNEIGNDKVKVKEEYRKKFLRYIFYIWFCRDVSSDQLETTLNELVDDWTNNDKINALNVPKVLKVAAEAILDDVKNYLRLTNTDITEDAVERQCVWALDQVFKYRYEKLPTTGSKVFEWLAAYIAIPPNVTGAATAGSITQTLNTFRNEVYGLINP